MHAAEKASSSPSSPLRVLLRLSSLLITAMISKSLLRQSAALRASSTRRLAAPTLSAPASRLRPTSLAVNKPRWYSSTPEPETAAKAEEAQADHKASSSPEDELKTRLEAKDREIAELKVCRLAFRT